MSEERIVEVDQSFADAVQVLRFKVDPKTGFQRELRDDRIRTIVRAAREGEFMPPIFVGELPDRKLVLIDGQHRLQAWRTEKFPLKAIVFKEKNVRDAAARFVAVNSHGVRVSLGFRLNVDPSQDSKWMRDLAEKHEVKPSLVYNVVVGVTGHTSSTTAGGE